MKSSRGVLEISFLTKHFTILKLAFGTSKCFVQLYEIVSNTSQNHEGGIKISLKMQTTVLIARVLREGAKISMREIKCE